MLIHSLDAGFHKLLHYTFLLYHNINPILIEVCIALPPCNTTLSAQLKIGLMHRRCRQRT